MKRTKKNYRGWLLTLVLTFGVFLFCAQSMTALAAGTAKVVASSGKIRASADTDSAPASVPAYPAPGQEDRPSWESLSSGK